MNIYKVLPPALRKFTLQFSLALLLFTAVMAAFTFTSSGSNTPVVKAAGNVVISEFRVRGPGGAGDEFIELFNRSANPVDISGWKISGSNNSTITGDRLTISNSVTLNPGQHYLATSITNTTSVAANQTYGTGITDDGGVALLDSSSTIIDQVGLSAGSPYKEGTNLVAFSASTIDRSYRRTNECNDADNNLADFGTFVTPSTPQNLASTATPCSGGGSTNPTGSGSANPATVAAGSSTLFSVTVTPGTNPTSTGITATINLNSVGGSASQALFDDGANGDVTAGDNIFSFSYLIPVATTSGGKTLPFSVGDTQARTGSGNISLTVSGTPIAIRTIQGAAHISPVLSQTVTTGGIVTAVRSNGFYLQDPNPDADVATSEGILVFTGSAPPSSTVAVGNLVQVTGNVTEFRSNSGCITGVTNNLTITELTQPSITKISEGNALPAPIVIGTGGRVPPTTVIDDDATGNVETSGTFDATTDGIDFYESLEGMRVQVNNGVATGPTTFGEIPLLGDNGDNASVRTTRGGIVVRPGDFNPERIFVDDLLINTPLVNVGATFPGAIIGVMDYSFCNFKLEATSLPTAVASTITKEVTTLTAGNQQLTVATFNVENLAPGDPQSKFDKLASLIITNLNAPDILSLEEIQDNNGATNDAVVDADLTFNKLISATTAAGGPAYQYRSINPVDDEDGGQPGGNIRVGFFFRTDRGVNFVDRAGGTPTTTTTVVTGTNGPELSFSPGRIDPSNSAFTTSRKPLAGEFTYNGFTLFVIANHFNSKGGDNALFGRFQPPVLASEVQRLQQAQIVNDFVDNLLAVDVNANIVVLGDINDFEFSPVITTLKGGVLNDLLDTLPQGERYTYVYEGNSQSLDHILVSNNLFSKLAGFDVVHVNSEFFDQDSDHDPSVARFTLAVPTPCVSTVVTSTSDDGSGTTCGTLSYAISQTSGITPTTITFALTGGSNTISVTGTLPNVKAQVTLDGGTCGTSPQIVIQAVGATGDGLVLGGNNTLRNLWVKDFGGRQIVANTTGNSLRCTKASKTPLP